MILIIGSDTDPHVQAVCLHLKKKACQVCIIGPDCSNDTAVDMRICGKVVLKLGKGRAINLDEVTTVWWRLKPKSKVPTRHLEEYYDANFASSEWLHALSCLPYFLRDKYWVNDRSSSRLASNKIVQLALANSLGFKTPQTLITNDAHELFGKAENDGFFFAGNKMLFKTLNPYSSPYGRLAYSSLLSKDEVESYASSIAQCPGIFQGYVDKLFELRVTVVGKEIYSAKIESQSERNSAIDWRTDVFRNSMYSHHVIDPGAAEMILKMQEKLGLVYAAYDFIVDPKGQLVFLEVNPAGQWMWLENYLGHSISKSLALILAREC